jgi:hypothetical protein
MAVTIVEALEEIDVEHQHRQIRIIAFGAPRLGAQNGIEPAALAIPVSESVVAACSSCTIKSEFGPETVKGRLGKQRAFRSIGTNALVTISD